MSNLSRLFSSIDAQGIVFTLSIASSLFFIGVNMAQIRTTRQFQESAINAGAAKWVINEKTGERQFQWTTQAKGGCE